MEIEITVRAEEDLAYWTKTGNIRVLKKIRTHIFKTANKSASRLLIVCFV